MLRPNLLNLWNSKVTDTALDKWIKEFGGTIYTRAYTPGPDTPRSQASTWSSRYPKRNGCDVRIKYPMYNLNNPENNFFRVFKDAGYELNFFITEADRLLGELPEDFTKTCSYSREKLLKDYLKTLTVSDNSLTYIVFDDFHHAVTDFYASRKAVDFGIMQIIKCLSLLEQELNMDSFDFILFYSDHGFAMINEKMDSAFKQLGEARSNVFMMTRKKGETRLKKDSKIRSVMDIGPTLCEVVGINIPYSIDGISLFDENGSDYVVISDHKTFNVDLNQTIEYWGIYNKHGFVAVDCDLNWEANYSLTEDDKENFTILLKKNGDFFEENIRATMVKNYYQNFISSSLCYFDGTPRKNHPSINYRLKFSVKKFLMPVIKKITL